RTTHAAPDGTPSIARRTLTSPRRRPGTGTSASRNADSSRDTTLAVSARCSSGSLSDEPLPRSAPFFVWEWRRTSTNRVTSVFSSVLHRRLAKRGTKCRKLLLQLLVGDALTEHVVACDGSASSRIVGI